MRLPVKPISFHTQIPLTRQIKKQHEIRHTQHVCSPVRLWRALGILTWPWTTYARMAVSVLGHEKKAKVTYQISKFNNFTGTCHVTCHAHGLYGDKMQWNVIPTDLYHYNWRRTVVFFFLAWLLGIEETKYVKASSWRGKVPSWIFMCNSLIASPPNKNVLSLPPQLLEQTSSCYTSRVIPLDLWACEDCSKNDPFIKKSLAPLIRNFPALISLWLADFIFL